MHFNKKLEIGESVMKKMLSQISPNILEPYLAVIPLFDTKKKQDSLSPSSEHGFTLMELLIVLALVAVISMIAVPIYRSYVQSAKVTEGLSLASSIQLDAEVYYSLNGRWPDVSSSHQELRLLEPAAYKGNSVESITLRGDEITVLYNDSIVGESGEGNASLILKADINDGGAIRWHCTGKNLAEEDLPNECS